MTIWEVGCISLLFPSKRNQTRTSLLVWDIYLLVLKKLTIHFIYTNPKNTKENIFPKKTLEDGQEMTSRQASSVSIRVELGPLFFRFLGF